MSYSDSFKIRNNIDFDIQHLSIEEKRKEIQLYNPLHYAFGYELKNQDWLDYGERNE